MIVLKRITQEGEEVDIGVPVTNISEVSPHKDAENRVWVKYWNGQEIRSMVIAGTVREVAELVHQARRGIPK